MSIPTSYEQVTYNGPDGAQMGKGATEKIAFYGATPVVQPTKATAAATTLSVSTSPFGFTTSTQANAVVTAVNTIITILTTLGLTT